MYILKCYIYTKIRDHINLGDNWFGDLYVVKQLILGNLACHNFHNFSDLILFILNLYPNICNVYYALGIYNKVY